MTRIYARALYTLAQESVSTDIIAEELDVLRKSIEMCPEYVRILDAANISKIQKIRMIDTVFSGVHLYIVNLMKMLAEKRHAYLFFQCKAEYLKIYERERGIVRARIILPCAVDEKTLKNIQHELCAKTGEKVILQMEMQPELIGGIVLEIGNRRFDNSIRAKLRNIRNCMDGNLAEE